MKRLWLLAPAVALYAGDVGLTLAGQPAAYWGGDCSAAVEANPIAYQLLARSPWLFAGLAAGWLVTLSAVVLALKHPAAGWAAVLVAVAHAMGGASWLTRAGPWGLAAAAAYIAVAAEASACCWRRFARGSNPDAEPKRQADKAGTTVFRDS